MTDFLLSGTRACPYALRNHETMSDPAAAPHPRLSLDVWAVLAALVLAALAAADVLPPVPW
jgi:hypothetical protein